MGQAQIERVGRIKKKRKVGVICICLPTKNVMSLPKTKQAEQKGRNISTHMALLLYLSSLNVMATTKHSA